MFPQLILKKFVFKKVTATFYLKVQFCLFTSRKSDFFLAITSLYLANIVFSQIVSLYLVS